MYIYIDLFIYIKRPIAVCYASIAATAEEEYEDEDIDYDDYDEYYEDDR